MSRRSDYVSNRRNRVKQQLVEYKGGCCQMCGYCKPVWAAYDFHHRDPSQKDFPISGNCIAFEKLRKEVDKCDLLCKTCHAEVHWNLQEEKRNVRLQVKQERLDDVLCLYCRVLVDPIKSTIKYCSQECCKMAQRKVHRPSREVLQMEIMEFSWKALGRKYGVTDNTIRKWAKFYEIKSG